MIDKTDYAHWLQTARACTRRRDEAEDLLQEALLAAIQGARVDLRVSKNRAWFAGVIRKKALMTARSSARRRCREMEHPAREHRETAGANEDLLILVQNLPRAARIVATLALQGMNRDEIACVLNLTPTALRQRITSIRRALRTLDRDVQPRFSTVGDDLQTGLLRQSLLGLVRRRGGFGAHDPDGHLLLFARSDHKSSLGGNDVRRR